MPSYRRSRIAGLLLILTALTASVAPLSRAQTAPPSTPPKDEVLQLDKFIVSASRTPQDPKFTSSSVSLLKPADLAAEQIVDLRTALAAQPGVVVVDSGAAGGQTSIFMRGASSHQTLFVVDGVRMNDRSAAYQTFFGQADLGGIDRVEVLRGPQSTLYGSSAMGGVILIDTTHGCGEETGVLSAMAGSFDTVGASASLQGGTKTLGYSGSVARFETDNDRPFNSDKVLSYATRVELKPTEAVLVGVTFRGQNGHYEEPGSTLSPFPGVVDAQNYLGTAYGQVHFGPEITSRLTAGWHQREYAFSNASTFPTLHVATSFLRNTRNILDWQNTWAASRELEVVAGVNYERSYYTINSIPQSPGTSPVLTQDTVKAGYASATYHPVETVALSGGVRYDDYASAGGATTWHAGVSWLPVKGTKLRATYGTGFSAPGSDDRYGVKQWGQLANPDLRPEKSRGWDAGFDQELFDGMVTVSATYFHNRFTDLFEWKTANFFTYEGMTVNVGRATTQGAELAITGKINDFFDVRLDYTYLDARDDSDKSRLIRRPRHVFDGEVRFVILKPWSVGVGAHVVAARVDGFTPAPIEDYTTIRAFTSYAVRKDLLLKLRVENLLNEKYVETPGYPALTRGVFGSVEYRF
jgi:vitamin B12 transporter